MVESYEHTAPRSNKISSSLQSKLNEIDGSKLLGEEYDRLGLIFAAMSENRVFVKDTEGFCYSYEFDLNDLCWNSEFSRLKVIQLPFVDRPMINLSHFKAQGYAFRPMQLIKPADKTATDASMEFGKSVLSILLTDHDEASHAKGIDKEYEKKLNLALNDLRSSNPRCNANPLGHCHLRLRLNRFVSDEDPSVFTPITDRSSVSLFDDHSKKCHFELI